MKISAKIRSLFSCYLSEYSSRAWMKFARACECELLDPEEVADQLR